MNQPSDPSNLPAPAGRQPDDVQASSPYVSPRVDGMDNQALQRPQFYIERTKPTFTRILIGINLTVFIGMIVYGYLVYGTINGTEDMRVLVDFGAKVGPLVATGQSWRLFTAMFLHIGVLHLLFNLYALYALGPMVEGYFGHVRFLAIYLVGGLFGSLASYAFSPAVSAGASGAIFALAGATTVYFLRYRDNFGAQGRAILQNMLVVIGINLVFGLSARGIDNFAHMGGLVGGAVMAWGLLPRYQVPAVVRMGSQPLAEENRRVIELLWVSLAIGLLFVGLQAATSYLVG